MISEFLYKSISDILGKTGESPMVSELKSDILHEVILRRPDQSHKGDYGHVLLIGEVYNLVALF